jgi:hypothetical protein
MSINEAIGIITALVLILLIVGLWSYFNKRPSFPTAPLADGLKYPGFQTFPTPRTFDSPGTVFRIDSSGTRFPVTTLPVSVYGGREALASYTALSNWTFAALLSYLMKAPSVEGSATGSFGMRVKVVLEGGVREGTFDAELDQSLKNALINYRKNNKYFVVRETISVSAIDYDFKGAGRLSTTIKETISKIVKGNQGLSWTDGSESTLKQKFDQPYRVFFTADELLSPGLGIGESAPKRVPANEPLAWKQEANQ